MASEMLYPVMPVYLKSIGFSIVLIGVLEGIAEATAGISKGYFGKLSDNSGKRAPFVHAGYAFSAISKPMMVMFIAPLWIFFARTIDRFGKGIRTGARDAILSDEATAESKGKVFGLHRAMDTTGAVLGPSIALLYLMYHPENYKALFLIAFIPGIASVLTSFLIRDKKKAHHSAAKPSKFFSFLGYWKNSPPAYRKIVVGLLVFTIVNSSDVFLLLKTKQSGLSDAFVIGIYIFYNIVYASLSFPIGILADKIGLKKMLIAGLIIFSIVYCGMAFFESTSSYLALFFLYGIYASATEGISKALISNITESKDTATAIGTFSGFQSICTLIASTLTGIIWFNLGVKAAFLITSIVTLIVAAYFIIVVNVPKLIPKKIIQTN
jgi:MFS family permease